MGFFGGLQKVLGGKQLRRDDVQGATGAGADPVRTGGEATPPQAAAGSEGTKTDAAAAQGPQDGEALFLAGLRNKPSEYTDDAAPAAAPAPPPAPPGLGHFLASIKDARISPQSATAADKRDTPQVESGSLSFTAGGHEVTVYVLRSGGVDVRATSPGQGERNWTASPKEVGDLSKRLKEVPGDVLSDWNVVVEFLSNRGEPQASPESPSPA